MKKYLSQTQRVCVLGGWETSAENKSWVHFEHYFVSLCDQTEGWLWLWTEVLCSQQNASADLKLQTRPSAAALDSSRSFISETRRHCDKKRKRSSVSLLVCYFPRCPLEGSSVCGVTDLLSDLLVPHTVWTQRVHWDSVVAQRKKKTNSFFKNTNSLRNNTDYLREKNNDT